MTSRPTPIEAAVAGMHAKFPDVWLHKREHEVTLTCDLLQFWLRNEPLDDRLYEFTLSFVDEDVRRWGKLASEQGVRNFNIEFHPGALWREMNSVLANPEYLAAHPAEGLEQLVGDLETMLGTARQALARRRA